MGSEPKPDSDSWNERRQACRLNALVILQGVRWEFTPVVAHPPGTCTIQCDNVRPAPPFGLAMILMADLRMVTSQSMVLVGPDMTLLK